MSGGLGLRSGTLALAPPDPSWAQAYADEAARLRPALGDAAIHHIGSTAVPGLAAKPILDLAVGAAPGALPRLGAALGAAGYAARGLRSGQLFVRMRGEMRTHNLHLYEADDPDLRDQIAFRDALRADAALRGRYAALKRDLAQRLGDAGRTRYAEAKTGFIRAALRTAG